MVQPPTGTPAGDPADEANEEQATGEELPGFVEADDFDLELDVHMEGHQEVGTLVVKGSLFSAYRASAIAVADFTKAFVTTVHEIAINRKRPLEWVAPSDLDLFAFGSARIRLIVGDGETIRMEDETSSPSVDAAQYVADLMQADGDELLTLAREAGPDGAKAYRQFLKVVADAEDAQVGWRGFGRQPVVVNSEKATKNFITLDREGEKESEELTVPGHLSMADAKRKQFRLELPSGWPRPQELKRKRNIEGTYEESVNRLVEGPPNLWNSDVVARIRINREREDTVAAPRKPKFELLSVEEATEPAVPPKGPAVMPGSAALDEGIDVDVFSDS